MKFFPFKLIPYDIKIDFLKNKNYVFCFSVFLVLASLFFTFTKGLNLGIDFTGGILVEVKLEKAPDLSEVRKFLKLKQIGDISIQTFGDESNILIRVGNSKNSEEERTKIVNKIKDALSDNIKGTIEYRKVDYVGPKVGKELIKSGFLSFIFAILIILAYISFRFEWQYGLSAVIALIHDVICTIGFFSITFTEFNLSSIAAILTIIGYSINDTVVIFDRIRENKRKFKKKTIEELLNLSISSNLSRTILTSFTTLLSALVLVLVGGEAIKGFSLAILFGIVVGTFSSIYIASPLLMLMPGYKRN